MPLGQLLIERDFCPMPSVHWTHCDHDTCPKMDTCHDHNGSNVTRHWTEATPLLINYNRKVLVPLS